MLPTAPFKTLAVLILFIAAISLSFRDKSTGRKEAVARIASMYQADMQQLDATLATYASYFMDSSHQKRIQQYHKLTSEYKKIEGLFTYFHPKISYETFLLPPQFQKRDVGPPLPDNWILLGPFGIDPDSVWKKRNRQDTAFEKLFISRAVLNLRKALSESQYTLEVERMTEVEIFDALRLQMARISTMGIANADIVIEEAGMTALLSSFESWTDMVQLLADQLPADGASIRESMEALTMKGKKILQQRPDFKSFDRMHFLTEVLIPLSTSFVSLQKKLGVPFPSRASALRNTALHVYDRNAFDADYFAPGEEAYISTAKAELGKFLFFDPILSDNNERACASCHKPEMAFTDGNIKSMNFERGDLPRNAPTVINAAFQKQQFWDLRATSLEDQLDSVINSPDELHSSFENVIGRINASREYRALFHAAFPETKKAGIQRKHVKIAIACYERLLTGMDSRFDQYVRGDRSKMNASEINGFNLYMGKAKCASCHYAPLFNGALPPYFDFTDHRPIGVPLKDTMTTYELDPDIGAFKPTGNPFFHASFKVPTVRNAELTAPYMHNGVYKTLEQVIEFYDHAGGNKFEKQMRPGMKGLPFFMILPEQLKLTAEEKKDLVAFIRALTDTSASRNIPHRLPKITGKYAALNERKIGGIY